MHFIKEIFLGQEISEGTHLKFTRYGRGEFEGAVIKIKPRGEKIKVEGSVDYVGVIAEILLKNNPGKIVSAGKIFSKKEMEGIIKKEINKYKKKLGLFIYEIKGEFPSEDLLRSYQKLEKDAYFLLNLKSLEGDRLNTKKNLPKPGKKDENFFSALLGVSSFDDLIKEIAWDVKDEKFKELKISHSYQIEELIVPDKYKNNFKEARIQAKRKGKIKRIIERDGKKEEREVEMLV